MDCRKKSWRFAYSSNSRFGVMESSKSLNCKPTSEHHRREIDSVQVTVVKEMKFFGVSFNEVALASLISAYSHLGGSYDECMVHVLAIKAGLEMFLLVSTNLVLIYCNRFRLGDTKVIFNEMPERNEVTWNVMLNGYSKMCLVDLARKLFDRIPIRDLVSWSIMIDCYVRADMLDEASSVYREMVFAGLVPNEVMTIDLVSSCGRLVALDEGQQLHGWTVKTGLECYVFMQATIIHFYAPCSMMDLACLQFESGCKDNIISWNTLVAWFVRNKMVDLARQVFNEMPERDVVSWSSMVAGYAQIGQYDSTLELFHDMLESGVQPNEITMVSVLSSIASMGKIDHGKWVIVGSKRYWLISISDQLLCVSKRSCFSKDSRKWQTPRTFILLFVTMEHEWSTLDITYRVTLTMAAV
ncbi:hypothetical protein IFM89_011025 [Coptis chinensis]|uniref:Pentatricopeptide repeat-containing protein n=1 Tax=Coptis chinensis TaxID=261450 RepID=A0A835M5S8_9MAGN|nr:hypothetical protein IFM89_011025 [Coptis chinensis]